MYRDSYALWILEISYDIIKITESSCHVDVCKVCDVFLLVCIKELRTCILIVLFSNFKINYLLNRGLTFQPTKLANEPVPTFHRRYD